MLYRNLYDSHVHLMATGQRECGLDLSSLKDWRELGRLVKVDSFFRGSWLVGFGWDESFWPGKSLPSLEEMDRLFPSYPVYFSRCDGHAGLTNSKGLEILRRQGGPLFRETEHFENLNELPSWTDEDRRRFLLRACRVFNRAGFTHVRDLGGNENHFLLAQALENEGNFTLQVDWNFPFHRAEDFRKSLEEAKRCRARESRLNKVTGIKIFFDGSLGSDTALMSEKACGCAKGKALWSEEDLRNFIREIWKEGFDVAVHVIGDEAAERVVQAAREVSAQGIAGHLHLEHVEVLRPETIQKMKPLHVTCHLQPCHWLSDRKWLAEKLGPLLDCAFPWEALRKARIPFYFGSDSPVEKPDLFANLRALRESPREKIPAFKGDPMEHHTHPSPRVTASTRIEGEEILEVNFDGRPIFPSGV